MFIIENERVCNFVIKNDHKTIIKKNGGSLLKENQCSIQISQHSKIQNAGSCVT